MNPLIKDGLTFGVALVGATLGVTNLWRAIVRDQVRLKVIPQDYPIGHGKNGLCFEVINLGANPVTLSTVGIELADDQVFYGTANGLSAPLPQRLESRDAFTVYWELRAIEHATVATGRRAFAITACGRKFYGNSPALRARFARSGFKSLN